MRCRVCLRRLPAGGACAEHPAEPAAAEPESTPPPPTVPGVSELTLIGQGGMAVVWRGRHPAGAVAVKVAREGGEARLHREVSALRTLGPPATPAFIDTAVTGEGAPCLIMELLEGRTLAELMGARAAAAVPAHEAVALVAGIAAALAPIHSAGWVHRDVKPENVVIDVTGAARLLDFGLARPVGIAPAEDPSLTLTGQWMGTVTYMSPEQCRSARSVDARADVYSLAVIAFELATGRPPFFGEMAELIQAQVGKRPPRPSSIVPAAACLDEAILRGLAKDPAERFATVGEMAAALRAGIAAEAPAAAAAPARKGASVRPVALVGLRTDAPISRLPAGSVVAVAGDRVVMAFADASLDTALRSAVRAARAALPLSLDQRVVVHVASLRVRHGPRGLLAMGAALQDLDGWWGAPGAGVVYSADATAAGADVTGETTQPARRAETASLLGRDDVVAAALEAARGAFASGEPVLVTVGGDAGMGKSRLLAAIADSIGEEAEILRLSAAHGVAPDALLGALLRAALGLDDDTGPGAVTLEPAVALTLGRIGDDDPAVAPLLRAPGALRHAAADAAARGLLARAAAAPLVVTLDEAHLADPAVLDALELATLEGRRGRLAVVVAGGALRQGWGERAGRSHSLPLGPLDPAAARAMLFELLHPVEFISDALVARVVEATGGVPGLLQELARALWDAGAVRHHAGSGWHLVSDDLLGGSTVPLAERLLERSLTVLPPSVAEVARVCAAIGDGFRAADVAAVLPREIETDAGVAIARLAKAGILVRTGDRYRFRQPMLRDAIDAQQAPGARRALAATILSRTPSDDWAAIARHASRAGEEGRAADAHRRLADDARRRHRYLDAEAGYEAALAHTADAATRRKLLLGRGEARIRLHRFADALVDFRAARALDAPPEEAAELLLQEATALDWMTDFPASAEAAQKATMLASPSLKLRCDLALGRSRFREEKPVEAAELLARAAASPDDDYETRVVALTLLAPALLFSGRFDEAERRFDDLLALAAGAGDALHLAVAYTNRCALWNQVNDMGRMAADTERAIGHARMLGHATLERRALFNMAEALLWHGSVEEAHRFARRARQLQLQYLGDAPDPWEALLLARVACACGFLDEARECLTWIRTACAPEALAPLQRTLMQMCQLAVAGAPAEEWDNLLREVRRVATEFPAEHQQEAMRLRRRALGDS